jgi:spore coat protein CotH
MEGKLTALEILNRTKQFFADLVAPAPILAAEPVPATEYDLKDGGKVTIDKLEVGGVVMIDGAPSLPGDLELADGTKVTVADNGVIAVLELGTGVEPVEPIGQPAGEDMGAKFASFETLTNEKFANYETKFSAYEQRFADYEVKMKKANKVIEQLLQLSQLIVESPAGQADPAIQTANTFKEEKPKNLSILFN